MGWHRAVVAGALGALAGLGVAGADRASWHGPWRGQDLYVTVVTRGHPIRNGSGPWWQWGNTHTDAYLFGFGRPGVDLILDFSLQGNTPQAALFVIDKAQRQRIGVRPDGYTVPPNTPIRMTLQPRGGDWLVGKRPNFNLRGVFHDVVSYGEAFQSIRYNFRVGSRVPGEPDWTTAVVADPVDRTVAYPLFTAAVRADPSVPYRLAPPLLPGFPYLSAPTLYEFYGPNQPLAYEVGSRSFLNRFVGFQTAGIYAFNSYALPPRVAFEAPFAWYRFDPRIGSFPNLTVRVEQFPPGYTLANLPTVQRTAIRLSWTGEDYRAWRYSLSVAGSHPLNERVQVGDRQVRAVPYARLPGWTTAQPWRAVSFVEATQGLRGSEGIYAYSVEANPDLFPWLNGLADAPPTTFAAPILRGVSIVSPHQLPAGYRGEYNLIYNHAPRLYLSPVDGRVHLEYALGGLWNLGDGYVLRTHNVNGGKRINAWLLERLPAGERLSKTPRAYKSEPLQSLFALGGYLLYSDARGAAIRRATLPPDIPLPTPDDRGRWQAFLSGTQRQAPRSPRNLRAWLGAFEGPTLTVPGGALRSVRATPTGFRLVLSLPRGTASTALPGLPRLGAGQHVLEYHLDRGRWTAMRATPAAVQGTARAPRAQAFRPGELTLTLRNSGTLDQSGRATLLVDGIPVKDWENLTVPGGGTLTERLAWSPEQAGAVPVAIRWQQGFVNAPPPRGRAPVRWQGPPVSLGSVRVEDTPRVEGYSVLLLSLPGQPALGTALLLGVLVLGGYGMWRVWGHLE